MKIDFCFFICLSLSLFLSLSGSLSITFREYLSQGSWAKAPRFHRSLQFPMSSRSKSLLLCMVHVKCAKSSRYARTMPGSCPTTTYYSSSLKISSMDFWNIILSFFSMRKYHKYPLGFGDFPAISGVIQVGLQPSQMGQMILGDAFCASSAIS